MLPAAFFLLLTWAPFDERIQLLMEPIRLVIQSDAYDITMKLVEDDGGKYPSTESVFSIVSLSPLQQARWPALQTGLVCLRRGRQYEIRRKLSFRVRRLPFGLFLVRLQLAGTIKERGKSSPTPVLVTAFRIVRVGRSIRVDLGKDKWTGDNRTWEVAIKGGIPQPRQ